MKKKTVWGNCIVKNEDKYLWFGLMSVINHLDKILVWDTGSSDQTVEIIKDVSKRYPGKIDFKEYGQVDKARLTKARQEMLQATCSDWLFILDGDEVWWKESIKKIIDKINREEIDVIVNPTFEIIGDIYHYQDEEAGRYQAAGRKGHLNIRMINRKIPGLHVGNSYPDEGYFDSNNVLVQNREKVVFIDAPYMHFSKVNRSSVSSLSIKRNSRVKYELGNSFSRDFKFPEVFYFDYPSIVSSPWERRTKGFILRAAVETPLKKLKRKVLLR